MTEAESGDFETITLHELLEQSARSALELQREDGSFPPGRNYTYDEPETPVRTTSHWAVTLSEVYKITGEKTFEQAANAAVDYLLSDEARPHGYTFHCRNAPGKDRCNGVVGQAGPIRALAHAGVILERDNAVETAEEVFSLHPFDEKIGLWERVEVDGESQSFDRTLNHQILFAAGASNLVKPSNDIPNEIEKFLDRLQVNMQIRSNGFIRHYARPPPKRALQAVIRTPRHWPLIVNEVTYHYYTQSNKRKRKEIGYQPVNASGLARIKRKIPDHQIWSTEKIKRAVNALNIEECRRTQYGSIVPGIAAAWVNAVFNDDIPSMASAIEDDIHRKLNIDTYLFESIQVSDPDQSSVISLLAGLPNTEIKLPQNDFKV